MKRHARTLIPVLCFLISTSIFAFEGHGGGGYHGGPSPNTGYHNKGYYNNYPDNYYHNNGWYGDSVNVNTDDGIWYNDNLNDDADEVVGVPEGGYYDTSCQTIDNCSSGTCVLVNTCDQE